MVKSVCIKLAVYKIHDLGLSAGSIFKYDTLDNILPE